MLEQSSLIDRHRRVMPAWMPLYYAQPIELVRGQGRHVWDSDGNRYLDFFGGILTTMTGYAIPEVVEAIHRQLDEIIHTSTLYLIRPMVDLAERIAGLLPIPEAKVFFTNSGSEANDAALLVATTYRRSNQVIAIRGGYHGRSHSTQAITSHRVWNATANTPFQVHFLPSPHGLKSTYGLTRPGAVVAAMAAELREVFETAARGPMAALIAEPIQGVNGYVPLPDGTLGELKKELDLHDTLLISDEVQTGWGRTGENFWGFQSQDVIPDLVTFAKGLGNGLAIAGVAGRPEVMESVTAMSLSTFGGNPLSTRGALANLEFLISHDCQRNALDRGLQLQTAFRASAEEFPQITEVRGKGLMIGIELSRSDGSPDPQIATQVLENTRRLGLLIGKGGVTGNVLRIAPPLTLTADEAEEGAAIVAAAIRDAVG